MTFLPAEGVFKMSRFLLLILLFSWSLLVSPSGGCETGVAYQNSALSIQRSLMANADVAFLKTFTAPSLEQCMEDCCSGKYGACSVAGFKKNSTKENCIHYNCRPLRKCKFLSSQSTDSFTFSSNPLLPKSVPSKQPPTVVSHKLKSEAKTNGTQLAHAKEEIATFSDEQLALKNDNTSVKPRKGVHDPTPDDLLAKSGIKPRKGVSLEDVPHSKFLLNNNKSNVKPRKGVDLYSSEISATPSVSLSAQLGNNISSTISHHTTLPNSTEDFTSDDLMSALQRVFEDDSHSTTIQSSTSSKISPTSAMTSMDTRPTTIHGESHTNTRLYNTESQSSVDSLHSTQISLKSSQTTPEVTSSSVTPTIDTVSFTPVSRSSNEFTTSTIVSSSTTYFLTVTKTSQPPTLPSLLSEVTDEEEIPEKIVEELSLTDEETESDRKYKSSIHLVLSLVFGLLVLFAVLGVVAKRVYDGWLRRDYYRMNYLIDGIYNGVD